MSMTGQQRLELEARRREELRLEAVRVECAAIVARCEATMRSVRDVAVQQVAATELAKLAQTVRQAESRIDAGPDRAREELERAQREIHEVIARGEAAARRWSEEQVAAVASARALVELTTGTTAAPDLVRGKDGAGDAAREAVRRAEQGDLEGAGACLIEGARHLAAQRSEDVEERVRREIVKRLQSTLRGMGFVVSPQLVDGTVVLDGRLPSGRRARFEVSLDGNMGFDLEGYEGRACGEELERIETTLRDRYGVRLGPKQVVWKNPDRLGRGVRDLPGKKTSGG